MEFKNIIMIASELLDVHNFTEFTKCMGLRYSNNSTERIHANIKISKYIEEMKRIIDKKKRNTKSKTNNLIRLPDVFKIIKK